MSRSLSLATVTRNQTVAQDTVILHAEIELSQTPRAGQFAMVHPLAEGCLLARPLSILDYREGEMRLLIKQVGVGTEVLCSMQAGDRLRVFAPLGRSFDAPELSQRRVIMVAGGVGIVPLHLLARELRDAGSADPVCLFGAQSPADLPLSLLDETPGLWQNWVERDPEAGMRQGLVTAGLLEAMEQHEDAIVATCGPTPMMKAVATHCRERGLPLWLCLEEQMGCGAGVCRACVVPAAGEQRMRTVCKEGPVFRMDEIDYV